MFVDISLCLFIPGDALEIIPILATPTTLATLTVAPLTLPLLLLLLLLLLIFITNSESNHSQEFPPWGEQVSCHVCSGACVVWSDSDACTADGKRDWVAAAMKHSMMLQKIRGMGPLVLGLMGMGMCVGVARWKYASGSQPSKLRTTPSS